VLEHRRSLPLPGKSALGKSCAFSCS
jgi:hypothetical protein